jgi:DNA-binding IscR family transcriptional regulator
MAPSDIRLSMVMACLGGTVTVVGCLDDTGMCVHVPACAQREVWRSVDEAIFNILDSTTIADLVERARAINLDRRQKKSPERIIKVVVG